MFAAHEFQIGFWIGFCIFSCYVAYRCFAFVHQGHVAVVSTFGKLTFLDEHLKRVQALLPGLHVILPWQRVYQVSVMEKCFDLSGDQGGITSMTADGTILRLDARLRVTPLVDNLYPFVAGLRSPVEHVKGLFTCLLRSEIAQFKPQAGEAEGIGSYGSIRRQRKVLNNRIEEFSRQQIGPQYGVKFESVDIVDIQPPEELETALNAVSNAQSEADTQLARAQAECQQKIIAAERGVAIAKHQAQATQSEIEVLGRYLKDLKTQGTLLLYLERRRSEVYSDAKTLFVRRPV